MSVDIRVRHALDRLSAIHLVGPGGVGKSTVGRLVARELGWSFLDLDTEFMNRIAHIGDFIREHGYDRYQEANSKLAHDVVTTIDRPFIAALSSGFLLIDRRPECGYRNRRLVLETGSSIVIIPSADIDEATDIVVARQLGRGFGLIADREREKFRSRFAAYLELGDMQIFSSAPPEDIAAAIVDRLRVPSNEHP